MKKLHTAVFVFLAGLCLTVGAFGQAASVTWPLDGTSMLTANPLPVGTVQGANEVLGPSPTMSILNYGATGQKLWAGFTGWVAGPEDPARYAQFDASPTAGNTLTVTSVSFNYGDNTNPVNPTILNSNVYYSTDNWTTRMLLNSTPLMYLTTGMTAFSTTFPAVTVPAGSTFSLRIYPYAVVSQNAGAPSSAIHNTVVISGTASAAIIATGTICGMKFNDLNGNGILDAGELGLPNWTIKTNNAAIAPVTTDAAGNYCFNSVPAGTYTITEVNQSGWQQTTPSSGSYTFALAAGQTQNNINFGNHLSAKIGAICGIKFNDLNGNGIQDAGEPGLPNWSITTNNPTIAPATTDASGHYCFNNLPAMPYIISEVNQVGWQQTAPPAPGYYFVSLAPGQNITNFNFGNQQALALGSICGMKFNDLNGNGILDTGEPGLPNWQIATNSVAIAPATTDAKGNYCFNNVPVGPYVISEVNQSGWHQTAPASPGTYSLTVTAGQTVSNINFGNQQNASVGSICGIKFNDLNGNGVQDSGEPVLANWQITLAGTFTTTTTTDVKGTYCFNNLKPGVYTVAEVNQVGWLQTAPPSPGTYSVTLAAGQSVTSQNFGNQLAPTLGSICGFKFNDLNGNGVQDSGEPLLPNWQIKLTGAASQTATTDSKGGYCFLNLKAGSYTVAEVNQNGWQQTLPAAGGTYSVTLLAGQNVTNRNFGNQPVDCVPPPSGMVAWWTGDGNANDIVGPANGAMIHGATYTNGEVGSAFSLLGANDYVNIPDAAQLNPGTGSFSIDAWIQTSDATDIMDLVDKRTVNSSTYKGYGLFIAQGYLAMQLADGASGQGFTNYVSSTMPVADGQWHHVAVSITRGTGATGFLAVDGVIALTFNPSGRAGSVSTTADLHIGDAYSASPSATSSGLNFNGLIDEVEFFDRALGLKDFASIYTAGSAGKCKCVTPPTGLVGWWPGDSDTHDITAYLDHGTLMNGATYAAGKVDSAFSLLGANDYVNVPDAAELNPGTGDFSIDAWIQTSDATDVMDIVDKRAQSGIIYTGYSLYMNQGYLAIQLADGGSGEGYSGYQSTTLPIADGKWHHITASITRTSKTGGVLYVDGIAALVFDPTGRSGSLTTKADLHIGTAFSLDYNFNGLVDEVEFFNRAITQADVTALVRAGSAGKCKCFAPPANMVDWWPGDDNAYDFTATLNHGTLMNGATFAPGKVGSAFSLLGATGYVNVPDHPELNPGILNFSIDAWIKTSDATDVMDIVDKRTVNSSVATGYSLFMDHGYLAFQLGDGGSGQGFTNYTSTTLPIADGQWHLVAGSIRRGSATGGILTVDGAVALVFDTTGRAGSVSTTADLHIGDSYGASSGPTSLHFNGLIDEVEFFRRALDTKEVAGIYLAGNAGKCKCNTNSGTTSFNVLDKGGLTYASAGLAPGVNVGYGVIQPDAGKVAPAAQAIFGFRQNGVLVTETTVAGTAEITSGRIFAEINGAVNTGLALANPGTSPATVTFYFTDANGKEMNDGTLTIPAQSQISAFLTEAPFNGPTSINGTFTFTATVPIGATALSGFTNESSNFLLTTLQVIDLSATTMSNPLTIAHFADGGGWKSEVVLVNPTNTVITGTVQFRNPAGAMATLTINGVAASSFQYSIPAKGSQTLPTSGAGSSVVTGSVRVIPATNSMAPSAATVFSYSSNGITVTRAGVQAVPPAMALRLFVETSGVPFSPNSVQTGLALANPNASATTVNLELFNLDGTAAGLTATVTLPANGQSALFLNQIPAFATLPNDFEGVLRITDPDSVSVVGLQGITNEISNFLITSLAAVDEAAPPMSGALVIPTLVDGNGYTTQFILFTAGPGQTVSGTMQLFNQLGIPFILALQ